MRTAELTEGGSYAYRLVARSTSDGPAALVVEAVLDAIEPGHCSGNSLAITTPDRQVQDRRCRPQELLAPWSTWLNDRAMEAATERRWDWRKDGLIGPEGPWEYVYDSSTQDRAATWYPDAMERGGGSWFDLALGPDSDSDPDHLVTIRVESVQPMERPDGAEQDGPEQDWPLGVFGRRTDDDRPVWIPNPLRLAPAALIEQWTEQMTQAAERRRRAMKMQQQLGSGTASPISRTEF